MRKTSPTPSSWIGYVGAGPGRNFFRPHAGFAFRMISMTGFLLNLHSIYHAQAVRQTSKASSSRLRDAKRLGAIFRLYVLTMTLNDAHEQVCSSTGITNVSPTANASNRGA